MILEVILENLIKITGLTSFIMIFRFLMNLISSLKAKEVDHCIAVSLPIWEAAKVQCIYLIEPGINGIPAWIY